MSGSMAETANFLKELGALPQAERRAAVETAFLAQVGGVLDIDPDFIDGEATLTELGADSLRLITIATRIQDMVGVTIPPNLLPVEASVGEIVDLLTGALGHEDPVASLMESQRRRIVEAMARDIYLHDGTGSATVRVTAEEAADPKRVFLTGATGFLGAYLMRELTEKTNAQIHCLVRAKSAEAGKQRLLDNLEKFNIPSEAIAPRLVVEPGDLGAPLFGLAEERYNELAETVDVVLHNGAAVHLTQHYDLMRGPNVEGTRTMLHFAGLGRMKPTAVISTVGLFDTPELEELPAITETDGPRDPGRLPNGYAQSKWAGERMVEMACALGIPAATLRVGHVIGHGVSEDLAGRLAQAGLYSAAVPEMVNPIDYVSPGYVASVIVHLPRQLASFKGVYHLANPRPFDGEDLALLLPYSPKEMKVLSHVDWLIELRRAAMADPDHPLAPAQDALDDPTRPGEKGYIRQILSRPRVDCSRVVAALEGTGVECPPARDILIEVLLGMPEMREALGEFDFETAKRDFQAALSA